MNNPTFIKVTNRDIYDKLSVLDDKITRMNGTLKWHTWAISVIVLILVAIISRIVVPP